MVQLQITDRLVWYNQVFYKRLVEFYNDWASLTYSFNVWPSFVT